MLQRHGSDRDRERQTRARDTSKEIADARRGNGGIAGFDPHPGRCIGLVLPAHRPRSSRRTNSKRIILSVVVLTTELCLPLRAGKRSVMLTRHTRCRADRLSPSHPSRAYPPTRKNAKRQHGDALTSASGGSLALVQFTRPVKTLWPFASFCQRSYQSQSSLISAGMMLWPRPFVTLYRTTFTPAALFHL